MIKIEAIAPDLAKGFYRKITDDSPEYCGFCEIALQWFCEIILQRGGSVIMGLWRIAQKGSVKLSCNKSGSLGLFKVFLLQNPTLKFPEITLQRFCEIILQRGGFAIMGLWRIAQKGFVKLSCNKNGSLGLFKVFLLQNPTLKFPEITLQRFCDHGALVDCNKSGSLGLFKVFLLQDRTLKYTIISALQPMGQTIPNLQRTKIDGF